MDTDSTAISDNQLGSATPHGFKIVVWSNKYDNIPEPREFPSFTALAEQVCAEGHARRMEKDGSAFSPVHYVAGATRGLAGVAEVHAIGLDLEHATPARFEEVWQALAPLEHVRYTTFSHTPEQPRWRVIIPLTRPVPPAFHPRLWEKVVELAGVDVCDASTKDTSRLFYAPAARPGAPVEMLFNRADGVTVFTLDPAEALAIQEDQIVAAMAQAGSTAQTANVPVKGLVEKPAKIADRPRPATEEILRRALAGEPNQWRTNLERLAAGVPFADPGARDAAAHGCASTLAFVAPEAEIDDIAAVFEPSVAAMWVAPDASNPPPTMDVIKEKIRRGLNAARLRVGEEEAFFSGTGLAAAIDAHATPPLALPVQPDPASEMAPLPPPAMFHGLAGKIVEVIAPHTEASLAAILVQLLVAIAAIFGRGPHFRVEATDHFCNEFAVIVGRSSKARKGTSWGWVIRLLRAAAPEWVENCIEHALSSGEGLIHRIRDEVRGFDKESREEIVLDPGVDDKRLLIQESEWANTLKMTDREGNILSSVVRLAWDGQDLGTLTKSARSKATNPYVSFVAHITREELRRLLTASEKSNGFANRFAFFYAERSKLLPDGGHLADEALLPFIDQLRRVIEFSKTVGQMRRDRAAATRWREIYAALSVEDDTLVGSLTARAEAHVLRFAMIFAVLDLSAEIRLEHLEAAWALWSYSEASCRLVFGDHLGDPVADAVLEALRKAPNGLSRTEIIRDVLGGHTKAQNLGNALSVLQRRGLAASTRVDTNGRPAEVWRAAAPSPATTPNNPR